jgi:hypothetical protein
MNATHDKTHVASLLLPIPISVLAHIGWFIKQAYGPDATMREEPKGWLKIEVPNDGAALLVRSDALFCASDAALLRDVAGRWQELSENPNATDCMTDHCHVELDELETIAIKIEAWLSQNASFTLRSERSERR